MFRNLTELFGCKSIPSGYSPTLIVLTFCISIKFITETELEIIDGATVTTTELNLLDGGTSVGDSITIADADGFIVNDNGTMIQVDVNGIKTYIQTYTGITNLNDCLVESDSIYIGHIPHYCL